MRIPETTSTPLGFFYSLIRADKAQQLICFLAALGLFFAVSWMKVHYSMTRRAFDPHDNTAYYWSEGALQYRYAEMAARGERIPEVDKDAEYPEGIDTRKELSILMERVTGALYRLVNRWHPLPFPLFVVYFYSYFSSLSILAFYFAALFVVRRPLFAFLAALGYGFNPGSWLRLIGTYEYEGFALPWLFLSFTFALATLVAPPDKKARSMIFSVFAGLTMAVGVRLQRFWEFLSPERLCDSVVRPILYA